MGAHMKFPFSPAKSEAPVPLAPAPAGLHVSFAPEVFEGGSPSEALQAQFPQVTFRPLSGRSSRAAFSGSDALMVRADAAKTAEIDAMTISLRESDNAGGAMSGRYDGHAKIPTVSISAAAPYGALFGGLVPGFDLNNITVSNAQAWTE